ncbi:unnamed protein product [Adineta steineri]|uniref:Blue (type 1) copper domain-containing protein n=1 Tax=Adineta steineri TaxID=433720 RepID=A0A815JGQ6_9BILA|nr:unnamed protein product [Adineta steineri]CAF1379531.1 unnamed protein product [Adineta steineri]
MARLSNLLLVVLAAATIFCVSADVLSYTATFVQCVSNASCPQGNPGRFNRTFALNDIVSPNLYLMVGDQLEFKLAVNVSIHPLTICQNSPLPKFCQGSNGTDVLNVPITVAGQTTSTTFTTAGTYYYGCNYHPGMGATITVFPNSVDSSSSNRHSKRAVAARFGARHQ